jgi:hypothetical protein
MAASEAKLDAAFTPSEVVLLRCDLFAPPPALDFRKRARFELDKAVPFAVFVFLAMVVAVMGGTGSGDAVPGWGRIVAAVVGLGLVIGYLVYRRQLKPEEDREDVTVVRPLGKERLAVFYELVLAMYSAALLANEQAGVLRFENVAEGLFVSFAHEVKGWPADSLEGRLRRGRRMRLSELIFDFLADGSNYPWKRAMKIAEHTAVLRGLVGDKDPPEVINTAIVDTLLRECREGRPEVWSGVRDGISAGLKMREVPPRMEEIGGKRIPRYDYPEQPVSELDRPESKQVEEGSEGKPKVVLGPWTFSVGLAAATLLVLLFYHPDRPDRTGWTLFSAIAAAAVTLAMHIVTRRAKRRLVAKREKYGLPGRPQVPEPRAADPLKDVSSSELIADVIGIGVLTAFLVALNPYLVLVVLTLIVGRILRVLGQLDEWKKLTTQELVAVRLRETARAQTSANSDTQAREDTTLRTAEKTADFHRDIQLPRIPEPVPAHDLPPLLPETKEKLSRWSERRERLHRLHVMGAVLLIGVYALLVAACVLLGHASLSEDVATAGAIGIGIPAFLCVAAYLSFLDIRSDSGLTLLIGFWRLLILLEVPFLFLWIPWLQPYFATAALLLLVLQWIWMDRAALGLMRELPVPEPHRLLILRVFGSPDFDDLVELIGPWKRVGMIEHLEGFDTVGTNPEVRKAVESDEIDRAIAMDMEQVRAQMAMATSETDQDLLFRRHSFQCSMNTWEEGIQAMMDRADVIVMDLSSFSEKNQGSAWELGQLLNRVPLNRVTVLINQSTEIDGVRRILDAKAMEMSANSPNASNPEAKWQLINIGGPARNKGESYFEWRRRLDDRLDPEQLAGWLLATAAEPKDREAAMSVQSSPTVQRWGRPSRWGWMVAFAASAVVAIRMARP